jgi:hydroxypyruvate isomerase
MFELSVCLEMFWKNQPFEQRISNLAKLEYKAFEFWGWANKDVSSMRRVMDETGLRLACCCMEPGYCLVNRSRRKEIIDSFAKNVEIAHRLNTSQLVVVPGQIIPNESPEFTRRRVVDLLKELSKLAEDSDITILLEPLNTIIDHFGCWLSKMNQAADIIWEVNSPSIKILMDIYHQQITEGNILGNIKEYIDLIGHFHCAGVPGRHELTGCELDYASIFRYIRDVGYEGYVGLEFLPTIQEDAALSGVITLL